jgi:antitoxin VapB
MMGKTEIAELFTDGGSQAVRLPRHFRLPGNEVRVRHFGRGVLLEPLDQNVKEVGAIFAEIDRLGGGDFLPNGRPIQPPTPLPDDLSFA